MNQTASSPSVSLEVVSESRSEVLVDAQSRRKLRLFYLISLPIWLSVVIRSIDDASLLDDGSGWATISLLLLFVVLFFSEREITSRFASYPGVYVSIQAAIVYILMMAQSDLDFFPILFIPVTAQIAMAIPRPRRYWWLGLVTVVMAVGLLVTQDWPRSLSLMFLYAAGYLFVSSYAVATEQAVAAESQSRLLVADLKAANKQLEANAAQIQALAEVEARNRLARDLHDSVSQSLYGLVLAAEATKRRLALEPPAAIAAGLDEIGKTARLVLGEMRLLIYELRPPALEEGGLAGSLQSRLSGVEQRSGITTTLDIDLLYDLPAAVESELDRIAQETLNNTLKHANATKIDVKLNQFDSAVTLEITDNGTGFEPDTIDSGGMGLKSLQERAANIGAQLTIDSEPGRGTRLRVVVPV